MTEDEQDSYQLIEQLAVLGADLERRVAVLEQRGIVAWLRRLLTWAQAGAAVAELRAVPTAAELLECPERALDLPPADAVAMLAKVGGLAEVLRARVAVAARNGQGPEPGDRLLEPQEAAARLGLTVKQVYRRAHRWAFTRRPSEGTLRFSERGLERFLAGKSR